MQRAAIIVLFTSTLSVLSVVAGCCCCDTRCPPSGCRGTPGCGYAPYGYSGRPNPGNWEVPVKLDQQGMQNPTPDNGA